MSHLLCNLNGLHLFSRRVGPYFDRPAFSGSAAAESEAEVLEDKEPNLAEPARLDALSDGAFAIIITLHVIEIHRPNITPGEIGSRAVEEWPSYIFILLMTKESPRSLRATSSERDRLLRASERLL
jgi:Endosomal/lysosomal potassium channel TMEM175